MLTKCGTVRRPDGTWAEDGSPAAVRADVEASLRRLGTDHVDVVQLHDPDPAVPVEETVGALAELVAAGSVGAIGLSNHPVELLDRGADVAPIAVVQHQWNVLQHDADAEAAATWARRRGARFLGLVAAGVGVPHRRVRARRAAPGRSPPPAALGPPARRRPRRPRSARVAAELRRAARAPRTGVGGPARRTRSSAPAQPAEVDGCSLRIEPLDLDVAARLEEAAAP